MATEYKLSYTAQEINDKLQKIDDVVMAPKSAEVGQTICVSEVDDNGKPVAWEAIAPVAARFIIWEATD